VTPANPSIANGLTEQFTATGIYTDNSTQNLTTQVLWQSDTTTTATISNASGSQGDATAAGVGSTTISATLGSVSGSTTLTVTAATLVSIQVTPANPSIANGLPKQFTATGIYTDNTTQNLTTQVTWASGTPSTATISNASGSQGLAASAGVGTSTISATLGTVSGSTSLTVTAATLVSISVTPQTPILMTGTTLQLTAVGTFTDSSTQDITAQVTWTYADGTVATVSNASGSNGLVSAVGLGSTLIGATSAGVTGNATLTVTPAVYAYVVDSGQTLWSCPLQNDGTLGACTSLGAPIPGVSGIAFDGNSAFLTSSTLAQIAVCSVTSSGSLAGCALFPASGTGSDPSIANGSLFELSGTTADVCLLPGATSVSSCTSTGAVFQFSGPYGTYAIGASAMTIGTNVAYFVMSYNPTGYGWDWALFACPIAANTSISCNGFAASGSGPVNSGNVTLAGNKLYFANYSNFTMYNVNADGSLGTAVNWSDTHYPHGVAFYGNTAYVTDARALKSCPLAADGSWVDSNCSVSNTNTFGSSVTMQIVIH